MPTPKTPAKKAAVKSTKTVKPAVKKTAPSKAAVTKKTSKPAARKTAVPKASKKPVKPTTTPAAKIGAAIASRYSKSQIMQELADISGIARKQAGQVLDHLEDLIARHLSKKGPGEFVLPGILKIHAIQKPATKARKGINPFTKEEVMFKAKPASTAVKVRPLKKLKDMATR